MRGRVVRTPDFRSQIPGSIPALTAAWICNTVIVTFLHLHSTGNRLLYKEKKIFPMEPVPTGEVDETLKRINSHPGVIGLIVLNPQGIAIKSTLDNSTTQIYASNFKHLTDLARSCVRDLDPLNDLKFLRVRSRKYEIMVAPEGDYSLIVIQNPNHREV